MKQEKKGQKGSKAQRTEFEERMKHEQAAPETEKKEETQLAGDMSATEERRPVSSASAEQMGEDKEPGGEEVMSESEEMKPQRKSARGRKTATRATKTSSRGSKAMSRKTAAGRKAKGGTSQRSQTKRQSHARSSKRHGD
jgi:hypothetical protein